MYLAAGNMQMNHVHHKKENFHLLSTSDQLMGPPSNNLSYKSPVLINAKTRYDSEDLLTDEEKYICDTATD